MLKHGIILLICRLMYDYHVPHQVKCAISPQTLTKLSSVNGEKFIKVAEVQGSEIKVLMLWGSYLFIPMLQCYECNLVLVSINFSQLKKQYIFRQGRAQNTKTDFSLSKFY